MTAAPVRQCVLLLDRASGDVPHVTMRQCGGRPVLAWVMREWLRFGINDFVLLASAAQGDVQDATDRLTSALPHSARITVLTTPHAADTPALLAAREHLDERFLLCRGDHLFDCNLASLLAVDAPAPLGHVLLPRLQNERHGPIDGALGMLRRQDLDLLPPDASWGDAVTSLLAQGAMRATPVQGWFCNTGDRAGFATAQQEAPRRLRRPALFLDRDGVLNVDHGWVGTRERFVWMPGALDTLRFATESGWHVFVVTNQSGVARGFYDEEAVRTLLAWMAEQAHQSGGTIDDARYCPYHESAVVEAYRRAHHWRKPQPGMLLDLIRAWELDPARCLMVGDQASDMQAAAAAGMAGHLFPGGNLLDFVRPLLAKR